MKNPIFRESGHETLPGRKKKGREEKKKGGDGREEEKRGNKRIDKGTRR